MSGFVGLLIRRERLKRDWSQQGLCRGICAVSYLSKIEQGKAQPSDEVAALLLERLGVQWHTGAVSAEAEKLVREIQDAYFSFDVRRAEELCQQPKETYFATPSMLDLHLLQGVILHKPFEERKFYWESMDECQKALSLLMDNDFDGAYRQFPIPLTCTLAGYADYRAGQYERAQERLLRAFQQSSEKCYVHLMLFCKTLLGNCANSLGQFDRMTGHYSDALRLAVAVGNGEMERDIRYNIAAGQIDLGEYQSAYDYYSALADPSPMELHKLAICCEALGKREEALGALDRFVPAETAYAALEQQMCDLVRYRLQHPDYLSHEGYGAALQELVFRLDTQISRGHAAFHAPWLEAYFTANRQYKQAWELRKKFPHLHN